MSALPSQSFISRSYTMIAVASCCRAITSEWSGRGSNPQPQYCKGWGVWEFQSLRRWGGVGLPKPLCRCSARSPVTKVSIPSEVERGRAGPSGKPCSTPSLAEFQSPRRWGGVGLPSPVTPVRPVMPWFQSPRRWGGVGLEMKPLNEEQSRLAFQSPRRWGGVGLAASRWFTRS